MTQKITAQKALKDLTLLDRFLFDQTMENTEAHERACPKGYQMTRGQAVRKRKQNIENHMEHTGGNQFSGVFDFVEKQPKYR